MPICLSIPGGLPDTGCSKSGFSKSICDDRPAIKAAIAATLEQERPPPFIASSANRFAGASIEKIKCGNEYKGTAYAPQGPTAWNILGSAPSSPSMKTLLIKADTARRSMTHRQAGTQSSALIAASPRCQTDPFGILILLPLGRWLSCGGSTTWRQYRKGAILTSQPQEGLRR